MKFFNARNALLAALVAGFLVGTATTASASWDRDNWIQIKNRIEERRDSWQDRRDTIRQRWVSRNRKPVNGVPEPSAALLFAGGGLIVAAAIRNNRRKQK